LEGGESKDRIACAGYLAGFGDMRSVPRIIRLVDELNGVERRRLCKALGKFGDSGSRRKLLWMLTNEQYSGTRARAALALGVRGNRRAVPGLIAALKQKSPDVRYAAAKALGVIGDSRAIPALRAAALSFPQGMRAYSMEERAREAASQAIAFLTTDRGSAPGRAPLDLSR
jgi:HEAT repeat protein